MFLFKKMDRLNRNFPSYWKDSGRSVWRFLCPLCEAERRVPFRPQPGGLFPIFQVALTSAVFTLATWKWFSWKGMVAFVPFWSIYEFFYRWRTRAKLSCPYCGFDPYLFKIDVQQAKQAIEEHWKKKFAERGVPYPEKGRPAAQPKPPRPPLHPENSP